MSDIHKRYSYHEIGDLFDRANKKLAMLWDWTYDDDDGVWRDANGDKVDRPEFVENYSDNYSYLTQFKLNLVFINEFDPANPSKAIEVVQIEKDDIVLHRMELDKYTYRGYYASVCLAVVYGLIQMEENRAVKEQQQFAQLRDEIISDLRE